MQQITQKLLNKSILFDIETCSFYPNGQPISIRDDFDNYVKYSKVKWIGLYSFIKDKHYQIKVKGNEQAIKKIFDLHDTIIGFNSKSFDLPCLQVNGLISTKYFNHIDVQEVLGNDKFRRQKNWAFYMKVNLQKIVIDGKRFGANSLQGMAHAFKLETLKGDIDYKIFEKDEWTQEEELEIKKYLEADIEVTKLLFLRIVKFKEIFIPWLYESDVRNWNWITASLASLTYKAGCKIKGVEPTYGEDVEESEEMGGRAIEPSEEEVWNLVYCDEKSKYPHLFSEYDLFNEVDVSGWTEEQIKLALDCKALWHGNDLIKVRGYYSLKEQSKLSKDILVKLKTRWDIQGVIKNIGEDRVLKIDIPKTLINLIPNTKIIDKDLEIFLDGLQNSIKLFLNALYGVIRSPIFAELYSPNAGYDCCWIGQQTHEYIEKRFLDYGYPAKGGFTDSWFFKVNSKDDLPRIKELCKIIMDEIKPFMIYPAETHQIGIECYMDYVMFDYDYAKKRFKMNNYCYITEDKGKKKVKVVGFPIIKDNSTPLTKTIYKKYLEQKIIEQGNAKFSPDYLRDLVEQEIKLEEVEIMYDCKPYNSYKERTDKDGNVSGSSCIQAQISQVYTKGLGGVVYLIKNKKVGRVGSLVTKRNKNKKVTDKDWYYGTLKECKEAGVTKDDLCKDKIYLELNPFCKGGRLVHEEVVNSQSLNQWGL